jgi:hypothetical protein
MQKGLLRNSLCRGNAVHFDKCKKHNWICEPIVNVTRIDHGFASVFILPV